MKEKLLEYGLDFFICEETEIDFQFLTQRGINNIFTPEIHVMHYTYIYHTLS